MLLDRGTLQNRPPFRLFPAGWSWGRWNEAHTLVVTLEGHSLSAPFTMLTILNYFRLLWTHVVKEKGNKASKVILLTDEIKHWMASISLFLWFYQGVLLCERRKQVIQKHDNTVGHTLLFWVCSRKSNLYVRVQSHHFHVFFLITRVLFILFCEGDSAGCEWLQSSQASDFKLIFHKDLALTPSKFIKRHLIKGVLKEEYTIINVKSIKRCIWSSFEFQKEHRNPLAKP